MVERATILPPQSYMGAISREDREEAILNSSLRTKYESIADDVGAYEEPKAQAQAAQPEPQMEYFYVNGMWYARPKAD